MRTIVTSEHTPRRAAGLPRRVRRRWAGAAAHLMGRWVCLDVGETLIDETRVWATWADVLGMTRLTFMAALGRGHRRGGDHRNVFDDPRCARLATHVEPRSSAATAGSAPTISTRTRWRPSTAFATRGYRVAIVANQPARRTGELRALGVDAEVMAMSEELGCPKPDPAFFEPHPGAAGRPRSLGRRLRRRPDGQRRPPGGRGRHARGLAAPRPVGRHPARDPDRRPRWWSPASPSSSNGSTNAGPRRRACQAADCRQADSWHVVR